MKRTRLSEWFFQTAAIEHAKAHGRTDAQTFRLERAIAAGELARHAFEGIETLPRESALAHSIALYGESAYWAAASLDPNLSEGTLGSVFDAAPADILNDAAQGELASVRALLEKNFIALAHAPLPEREAGAERAKSFAERLLDLAKRRQPTVASLRSDRAVRIGLTLAALVVLLLGVRLLFKPGNLAAGKAWKASSAYLDFGTEGRLPDRRHPFCHTKSENGPWVEVDLEAPRDIAFVQVENRSDCCGDRAVPLIAEVSTDHTTWSEVARRGEPFSTWTAAFPMRSARWVRLRAPRTTNLHLDDVRVYASQP